MFPRTRGLGKKVCGCTALHPTSLPRLLRLCARGRWFVLGRRDEPRRTVPVQRARFPFQSAAWIGFNRQVSLLSTPTVETSRSGPEARTHDIAIRIRSSHERIVEALGRASRIRDVCSDAQGGVGRSFGDATREMWCPFGLAKGTGHREAAADLARGTSVCGWE